MIAAACKLHSKLLLSYLTGFSCDDRMHAIVSISTL